MKDEQGRPADNEKAPPVGVMPRWRWLELRLGDIAAAIGRYGEAGKPVPRPWLIELRGIAWELLECKESK